MENSIKNIYEELNSTLNSFSFIDRYRLSQTAFIRNRTLSFPTLILYLLNLRKLFSGLKKGGFCNHLRGFFFFINHLEKLV
jgi:hypothetical protein